MKVFILILSCEKFKKRRERQNINVLPFPYLYFIGDSSLKKSVKKNDIVYLPCKDTYECLTSKTLLALQWIKNNINEFDYIIKTDDDVEFNKIEIQDMCQSLSKEKTDYAGLFHKGGYVSSYHFGKCLDTYINQQLMYVPNITYCAGGAYWLSRFALDTILSTDIIPYYSIFEDATIGNILISNGFIAKEMDVRKAFKWPEE